MAPIIIFNISGLAILILIVAKKIEEKRKKPIFISNLISRGDIHIRRLYHVVVHLYSEGKEKVLFFLKKQIRMHSKNSLNKTISFLEERRGRYINNMRDSRLLRRKTDGISEFFKNISNVEKGNGVIHDGLEDGSQSAEESVK